MKMFPVAKTLGSCLTYLRTGQRVIIDHYDADMPIAPECDYSGTIQKIGLDHDGMLHIVIESRVDGSNFPVLVVLRIPTSPDLHTQIPHLDIPT